MFSFLKPSLSFGVFDPSSRVSYAIFDDGVYLRREEPVGIFTIPRVKQDYTKMGSAVGNGVSSFEFKLPKIPVTVLNNIIEYFREVKDSIKSEVYISIYWNLITKDYFLHVPPQKVAGASVNFSHSPEIFNNPDYVIVADIHSHVDMGAFFSGQDLKDEIASRLFGVIGKLSQPEPAKVIRAASNGKEIPLTYEDVFDYEVEKLHESSNYEVSELEKLNVSESRPSLTSKFLVGGQHNRLYGPKKGFPAKRLYGDFDHDGFGFQHGGYYDDFENDYKGGVGNSFYNNASRWVTMSVLAPKKSEVFIKLFKTSLEAYGKKPEDFDNVLDMFTYLLHFVSENSQLDSNKLQEIASEILTHEKLLEVTTEPLGV